MIRLASALFLLLLCGAASAATFQNGSFEIGGKSGTCTNTFNIPVPCGWLASNGSFSLDLVGIAAGGIGGIEQTFDTVPGATYKVSFYLAGNYGGLPVVKPLTVTVAGVTQTCTFDTTGKSQFNMGWTHKHFRFVATSTSATINFVSNVSGLGGLDNAGAAIDSVNVQESKYPGATTANGCSSS